MAREVNTPDNRWNNNLRAHLDTWNALGVCWTFYSYRKGTLTTAEQCEEFLVDMFVREIHPREGYAVNDLQNPTIRLVIGFLNPIFHPKKLKRLKAKSASTFLATMAGLIKVDWVFSIDVLVTQKISNIRKVKKSRTPCPSTWPTCTKSMISCYQRRPWSTIRYGSPTKV